MIFYLVLFFFISFPFPPHIVTEIQYKTGFVYAKENINFTEEKFKGFYGSNQSLWPPVMSEPEKETR